MFKKESPKRILVLAIVLALVVGYLFSFVPIGYKGYGTPSYKIIKINNRKDEIIADIFGSNRAFVMATMQEKFNVTETDHYVNNLVNDLKSVVSELGYLEELRRLGLADDMIYDITSSEISEFQLFFDSLLQLAEQMKFNHYENGKLIDEQSLIKSQEYIALISTVAALYYTKSISMELNLTWEEKNEKFFSDKPLSGEENSDKYIIAKKHLEVFRSKDFKNNYTERLFILTGNSN